MKLSNLRTGQGLHLEMERGGHRHDERAMAMDCAEWMRRYKQMAETNIYVDAFECYPKISKLHRSTNALWKDVNERLMSAQRREQIVFILTHFHWDSYRGLMVNHKLIFNERNNNVLYCSETTAKLIRFKIPELSTKYIKILRIDQTTPIPEALPKHKDISIIAIDSKHCSGSILCILTISAKHSLFDHGAEHHLHSGDCNLTPNDFRENAILNRFRGKISNFWIDTKSISFWLNPLNHCDALTVITRHILDELIPSAQEAQSSILIEIGKYSVGLEPILIDIARHLMTTYSMKLCVQNSDVEMLEVLGLWGEHELHRFFQTPTDWNESKDALKKEHLRKLEQFTERQEARKSQRKVALVEFGEFPVFSFCVCFSSWNGTGSGSIHSLSHRITAEVAMEKKSSDFQSVHIVADCTISTVSKWRARNIGVRRLAIF